MADEIPRQVTEAGLDGWYGSLSPQDRVRVRRYVDGISTGSELAFLEDLMARAVDDHNYKLAVTAGEHLEGLELSDRERFEATEGMIEGLFGSERYEEARDLCMRNLDLFPAVRGDVLLPDGSVPEHLSCRNRLIDIMVGVFGDYEGAYAMLDRFLELGLVDEAEKDYRLRSLKIHRMQRTFDNVFNLRETGQRRPSTGP